MPYKDPIKRKAYHKAKSAQHYEANKAELKKDHNLWRKTNPDRFLLLSRNRSRELKLMALQHYCRAEIPYCQCPYCDVDYIEFLSIDHINGCGNEHRRQDPSSVRIYRWLYKHGYPEGFRVLCMNCNFALGHFGYCPHVPIEEEYGSPEYFEPSQA